MCTTTIQTPYRESCLSKDVDIEKKADSALAPAEPKPSVTTLRQTVQEIISKELSELNKPLYDDLSDTDYRMVKSESSLDNRTLADDIIQPIINRLKVDDSAGPTPKAKDKCMQCMQRAGDKIRTFFTKQFTKASILRIVSKLKSKSDQESKKKITKSMHSLMESVDNLLLTETGENPEAANDTSVFWNLKKISSDEVPSFIKSLSDHFYGHIRCSSTPDAIMYTTVNIG